MDGFSYVNMFDTKGMEYLIIIAFLLLIIPFWKMLNRPLKIHSDNTAVAGTTKSALMSAPRGFYFCRNHTWAHMLRSGDAKIGIDSLLLNLTGLVELRMLQEPGNHVKKGEAISEIIRDGKRLTITSPVSGSITCLNHELLNDPSALHEDPYGTGWVCSVKPDSWLSEITAFYFAAEANSWMRKELERVRDFLAAATVSFNPERQAVYMQDGGEPADYPLASLPEKVWSDFQKEFLD